jgi:penicillin-binding protein-related factor A (putative recombinase)
LEAADDEAAPETATGDPASKRNRGRKWEHRLSAWHRSYKRGGLAFVFKCHPGVQQFAGNIMRSKKGAPDYCGIYGDQGRFICFDAKSWKTNLALPFSKVQPHQAAHFDRVRGHGGIVFLAIDFASERGGFYAVPWTREISRRYATRQAGGKLPRGAASIKPADGIEFHLGSWDWETSTGTIGGWFPVLSDIEKILDED